MINKKLSPSEIALIGEKPVISVNDALYLVGMGGEPMASSTFHDIESRRGIKLKSFKIGRNRHTRPEYVKAWIDAIEQDYEARGAK